jgi:hypothetical protein
MNKYVMNKTKTGITKEAQTTYNSRLANYAVQAFKDLELLANELPEDLQNKIFNEENMQKVFKALFTLLKGSVFVSDIKMTNEQREGLQKRRERILNLCYSALEVIGGLHNAWNLTGDIMQTLTQTGSADVLPTITGLRAVYFGGLRIHQVKKQTEKKKD